MLEYGARNTLISNTMFAEKTKAGLFLLKLVLETLEFYCNNKCATVLITKDMIKRAEAEEADTDGLSAIPNNIKEVSVGITFREKSNGEFKVSFRCDTDLNVADICKKFGGGGHPGAAGCTLVGDLASVKQKIINEVSCHI
jgi:phosphoesterase RecJ-like protein